MNKSGIQWCDDTENPGMGCDGCELWPTIERIQSAAVNLATLNADADRQEARNLLRPIIREYDTPTELWHNRQTLIADLRGEYPVIPAAEWTKTIESLFSCYAGHLHLRWAGRSEHDILVKDRGYAPIFERPTKIPGRMAKTARKADLRGTSRSGKPWLNGMPRLIFVSDMADILSAAFDFDYLKSEIIDVVTSVAGRRHLWLWLTKQPKRMAEFAEWLVTVHGLPWPDNLVAMTSVTNRATRSRINQLRQVPAKLRGLSVEPLVEPVELDLAGIDWLIVGGESGGYPRAFDIEWARSLREQCRPAGVAFFVKQLGANAVEDDFPIRLRDSHGGNWDEWPEDLRVREFPAYFHQYRGDEGRARKRKG